MDRLNDAGLFVLRLTVAVVLFPHGAQKVLGWFGGYGASATIGAFPTHLHLPAWIAVFVMCAEFLGTIFLVLGFLTRLSALAIAADMAGAVAVVHGANGWFMNWSGQQKGEGVEFFVALIGSALALVLTGAGRWSLDWRLFRGRF